jgi:hypothetical protein
MFPTGEYDPTNSDHVHFGNRVTNDGEGVLSEPWGCSYSSLAVIHAHPNSALIAGHEFTSASNTWWEDAGRA